MSESNINVAIKMRPLIKREIDKKIPACWVKKNAQTLVDTSGTNEFTFGMSSMKLHNLSGYPNYLYQPNSFDPEYRVHCRSHLRRKFHNGRAL